MKNQKELVIAWTKIELNSSYRFPPIPNITMEFDKDKALQITEEGKNNIMFIQEALKNI